LFSRFGIKRKQLGQKITEKESPKFAVLSAVPPFLLPPSIFFSFSPVFLTLTAFLSLFVCLAAKKLKENSS